MTEGLISIIVVSYNNLQYYKECLDSIFMQDYHKIELIFSDDSSENFNESEIQQYINDNKRDNIINNIVNYNDTNLGTVKHLNKVISMSHGEVIKIVAVDDMLYGKDTISKVIKYLNSNNALICIGYVDVYDKNMKRILGKRPSREEVDIIKKSNNLEIHKFLCISGRFLPAPSRVYSRKFFNKYGLYDEDYTLLEDRATIAKAIREGCRIHFIDETIAKYRDGGISSVDSTNLYLKKDLEVFIQKEALHYWGISFKGKRKDYIIWGTSTKYLDNREKILQANVKYFVDSDINKHGKELDERLIYSPEKLLEEDVENAMIIICSAFHLEISNWLEKKGFRENKNYINVNFIEDL